MASRKAKTRTDALSAINDPGINIYLKQISSTTPLTSKEENELSALIQAGDAEALKKLVLANLRFVVSVALTYSNQGLAIDDLINIGNLGLIRAAKRFDGQKNFRFISYAVWWIRQAILQGLADQSRIVRLPINRVGEIYKIDKAQRKLQQRKHRAVTAQEIADEIGVSGSHVHALMQVATRHTSLDAPTEDGKATLLDKIAGTTGPIESHMADLSLRSEVDKSLAFLDEREREVIYLYFGIGYDTAFTLEEIGLRYGITRERVRQIKEEAIKKLKKPVCNGNLRDFHDGQ